VVVVALEEEAVDAPVPLEGGARLNAQPALMRSDLARGWVRMLGLLLAALPLGCLGFDQPPRFVAEAGVKTNILDLRRERVFSLPEESAPNYVFEIRRGAAPDRLFVVTSLGALELGPEGQVDDKARFSTAERPFPVVSMRAAGEDGWGFVGLLSEEKQLGLFDGRGGLRKTLPCGVCTRFAVGDLLPDPGEEILAQAEDGHGLRLYDRSGALRQRISTSHYLTAFRALSSTAEEHARIVLYTYPTEDRKGRFQVVEPDGQVISEWQDQAIGDFNLGEARRPGVRFLFEDTLMTKDLTGNLVSELPVPHGSYFREVHTARWGADLQVLLASGSGYRPYSMVCVYRGSDLVFQEVREGRSYALLVPDPAGPDFFVGAGAEIWRYSLAGTS
jgi:hypothetical protein